MKWTTLISILLVSASFVAAGLYTAYKNKALHRFGAALVFVGFVIAAHLIPLLGFPWPLLATKIYPDGWQHILSIQAAVLIDVAEWTLATILFICAANKMKFWFLPIAAALAVTIIIFGAPMLVRLTGLGFYWKW